MTTILSTQTTEQYLIFHVTEWKAMVYLAKSFEKEIFSGPNLA
jgi:hypothetical protein